MNHILRRAIDYAEARVQLERDPSASNKARATRAYAILSLEVEHGPALIKPADGIALVERLHEVSAQLKAAQLAVEEVLVRARA